MNGTIEREIERKIERSIERKSYEQTENEIMPENCNFSGYSMATVAGSILLCIGIVIYAILTH